MSTARSLPCPSPLSLQTEADFESKPMVMLLGQYSTGKTTFIKNLLKMPYPGETGAGVEREGRVPVHVRAESHTCGPGLRV